MLAELDNHQMEKLREVLQIIEDLGSASIVFLDKYGLKPYINVELRLLRRYLTMQKQADMVKNARVEMRIPQSLKDVWQYAATMKGNSLAEYIIGVVSDRAARDVEQQHVVHLSVRDQMNLLEALELPEREPGERTKRALKDYDEAIEKGMLVVRH